MYNYYEEVLEAVKEAAKNEWTPEAFDPAPADLEDYAKSLNSELWIDDSVTGNASGSYFCNAYKAEKALAGNWELAAEAMECFGDDCNPFEKGAEWVDVTIRCYLLNSCIADYIEQNEDDLTERIERLNG